MMKTMKCLIFPDVSYRFDCGINQHQRCSTTRTRMIRHLKGMNSSIDNQYYRFLSL